VLVALVSRMLLLVFDDATAALTQAKEELWRVQYGIGVLGWASMSRDKGYKLESTGPDQSCAAPRLRVDGTEGAFYSWPGEYFCQETHPPE
jgi:hypothetical protein